jgi:hypothetical protein
MEQLQLFPTVCPVEDDDGNNCNNVMTTQEIEQDGYCERCASGLWDSNRQGKPFLFSFYKE